MGDAGLQSGQALHVAGTSTLYMATSALTRFGSGFTTSDTLSIVAKTKKLDVNNHLPLEYYYRMADSLLIQVCRGQVWIDGF